MHKFESDGELRSSFNCYEPCKRYDYKATISESKWPGSQYVADFIGKYVDIPYAYYEGARASFAYDQFHNFSEEDRSTKAFADLVRINYARLNVYFKEMDMLIRKEEPSYGFSAMWSDIGGTIGLWAGLSVITLVECMAFVVRLIVTCCKRQ